MLITSNVPAALPTRRHSSSKFVALCLAAAIVLITTLASHTSAQTFRGTILGTVTDPNGAVVPGAIVTAKNVGTSIERSTTSDEFGNYTLAELQTGAYQVVVTKTGFSRCGNDRSSDHRSHQSGGNNKHYARRHHQ